MARLMEMVKKPGQIRLLTRVSISSARNMAMEHLLGVIEGGKGNKKMICLIFVNVM